MSDFPITNGARESSRKSKVEYDYLVKLGVFSAVAVLLKDTSTDGENQFFLAPNGGDISLPNHVSA
jgi:hypothetical protein